jgi:hypothetical protein
MTQTGHVQPDQIEPRPGSPVTRYLAFCRALGPGPLDRATLARLAALERAARRAWGEPTRRSFKPRR